MNPLLVDEARMIVNRFVKLTAGELVALVTDHGRRDEAEALALAADETNADYILIDTSRQVARVLRSETFWIPPPQHLIAAVQHAQVSIFTVDETYAFRLDHHVRELFNTGPDCSIYKVDLGMGTWGITEANIEEVESIGARLLEQFEGADNVHITSPAGTDLTLSIRGRDCLAVMPVPERGKPYATPIPLWGEYNWAPVEGSTNGTLMIDGISEATPQLHVVDHPVAVTIVDGKVTDVSGGRDADEFRKIFGIDDSASIIGEFGVGGNPKAIPGTETEKALLGTIHIGFGNNDEYPGGAIRSGVHIDGGVRRATIAVDGRRIIESGKLLI